jgi:photosystem II stability/assembly factor-like uncharacterized protein
MCGQDNLSLAPGANGEPHLALNFGAGCTQSVAQVYAWAQGRWQLAKAWEGGGVSDMAWPSGGVGYLVFNGALAGTDNGGRGSSQLWPLLAPTGPLAPLNVHHLLAAGALTDPGAVLDSADGGATWSALAALPGDVLDIDFPNATKGYVALCDPQSDVVKLEVSVDGGHTWSSRSILPDYRGGDVSGLWMTSGGDGLLVTTWGDPGCARSGVGPATVWATDDGGRSWAKAARVPVPVALSTASFVSSRSGSTSASDDWTGWSEGGQDHPELTFNGGRTWEEEPTFPLLGTVQLVSPKVMLGWGTNSHGTPVFWYSANGGGRWAQRALPVATYLSAGPATLAFANIRDGWATSAATHEIWATTDAGLHWLLVSHP